LEKFDVNELLDKGRDCFTRGDYKRAAIIFNEIIEVGEANSGRTATIEAYFHLANIFHIKGEIGKAIKGFNKVLSIDPNHTDASISLSVLYNDIGHYESAKKVFEQASERVKSKSVPGLGIQDKHINNKFSSKHYELAELYMSYDRYDEALFEYNKTTSLNPENFEAKIKVAKVYAKKGFMGKAFDELRTLKNENPDYLPARLALGILFYGNGNILEAQTEWEKVLSKEPTHAEAAMYLNLSRTATETTLA
jgi:tetratricopeptide (TPR) repeat protein